MDMAVHSAAVGSRRSDHSAAAVEQRGRRRPAADCGSARPRRPRPAPASRAPPRPRAAGSTCWRRARPWRSNSWCVPRSTITPLSSTMISSAPTMVESRCAITSVVRLLRHPLQRVLDFLLGVAVERGGRLVEQQDRRRLEDGAGDGDALLLAAGQLQPALADLGLVAVRRHADEVVDLREPRRLLDLGVGRLPAAVADVVADGVVEQHGVLRDHADGRRAATSASRRGCPGRRSGCGRRSRRRSGTAAARSSTCRRPTGRRWRSVLPAGTSKLTPLRIGRAGS